MNIDDINNKIQAEKDSYNRNLNRLNQEILKLTDINALWQIYKIKNYKPNNKQMKIILEALLMN